MYLLSSQHWAFAYFLLTFLYFLESFKAAGKNAIQVFDDLMQLVALKTLPYRRNSAFRKKCDV